MKSAILLALVLSFANVADAAQQRETSDPAAAAPQPAAAAADVGANSGYIIGASDVLTVTVWREPTLSGSILVRPDGMISLALLGDVQASGLTPLDLANQISQKLKKFYQDPKVSVVVTAINSKQVFLIGEVTKKGPVPMTSGMTLLEAISSAGGLTDFANAKKIYVLRNQEKGSQIRIPINYKAALKGDSNFNLALKPGDTIVVP